MQQRLLDWQAADTVEALASRYHTETRTELTVRWHALWLLRRGFARTVVCDLVDINPRTLRDWLAWYGQGGCAEVARHLRGGRQGAEARLSLEQQAELAAWTMTGLLHTIDEVRQWVEAEWGVVYTYWGMRSLLDRLKIHAKVPRPQAVTADPAVQDAWTKGGQSKRSRMPA